MEAVAIVGGLPLLTRVEYVQWRYSDRPIPRDVHYPLWDNTGALVAFIIIAAGVNLYLIRHQSTKVQVITTIIVVGVLLATALGVKAWKW